MKIRAIDRKMLRDLRLMRGQVIAVALVVACGISTLVTTWTAYRSLVLSQSSYYQSHRFADVFVSLRRAPNALARKFEAIPGVTSVRTRVIFDVTLDVPGLDEPATGRLVSIPEHRTPMLNDLFILRGRYIEPGSSDEVIVSESFSKANRLEPGDSVSAVINGRWRRLLIVGVAISPEYIYEIRGTDLFPDPRRFGVFWMGHRALSSAFTMEGAFNDAIMTVSPEVSTAAVVERIDTLLEPYGGTGAYDREQQISHRFISDEIAQNEISGTVMPAIFLGVAAFLIHIVLSRLIQTQRDQIAVLKAFGYSNVDVGMHYMKLAFVVIAAGAILGVAVGVKLAKGLATLYAEFYNLPALRFDFDPLVIGVGIAVSALAATAGALNAVRIAVALPPAEAMRPEAPPTFHPGIIERLGLMRYFSAAGRIIIRNITRRRMKAALSILGVAMAVAILLVGRYSFDAIDLMMKVQFSMVQREDVTVSFYEPRERAVLHDLAHLPGVLSVEPFRAVPVRLRHEHRMKRTALLGLDAGSSLHRVVGRSGKALGLPPDGIVMTDKLAEILGVSPGEAVEVEVLDGARPKRRMQLVRTVDELLGVSAYVDSEALARMLHEGRQVSGAYMLLDSSKSSRLNDALKKTPAIAGVSFRKAMLQSFEDTIAKSFTISTFMLVVFACVIALGVVYNGARIALSERGRELASLRVLGFTKGEVSMMLLGEQAILTLVAVPVGYAIGYALCAILSKAMDSELYRLPVVISSKSYAFAFSVIVASAVISGLLVNRRVRRLDLVEVLKTRE